MALLPAPGEPDALYLVDLSGWARGLYEGAGPDAVVRGCVAKMIDILADQRPAYLAFALDPPDGVTWHAELWSEYHASRTRPSAAYHEKLELFLRILAAHTIPTLSAAGFAADDVIATATTCARRAGLRVVIVSRDQDLWQLLDEAGEVVAWDGKAPEAVGAREVRKAYHGIGPDQLGDLLALAGDGDEAPGVKGVGDKTAARLLLQRRSLAEVLRKYAWEKGKLSTNLRDCAEDARLGRRLVTLREDAPIRWDLDAMAVGWGEAEAVAIRALGDELGVGALRGAEWLERIAPPCTP